MCLGTFFISAISSFAVYKLKQYADIFLISTEPVVGCKLSGEGFILAADCIYNCSMFGYGSAAVLFICNKKIFKPMSMHLKGG